MPMASAAQCSVESQVVVLSDSDDEDEPIEIVSVQLDSSLRATPLQSAGCLNNDNRSSSLIACSDEDDEDDVQIVAVRQGPPPSHLYASPRPISQSSFSFNHTVHRHGPGVSTIFNVSTPYIFSTSHHNSRVSALQPPVDLTQRQKDIITSRVSFPISADALPRPVSPKSPSLRCSICLSTPTKLVSTICGHMYCESCLVDAMDRGVQGRRCPICRKPIPKKNGYHPLFY